MPGSPVNRRTFLRSAGVLGLSAAGVARLDGAALAAPAPGATTPAGTPVPGSWVAQPFALEDVSLPSRSLFRTNRDRMLAYARAYPVDGMLDLFRINAGLETVGVPAPGGWEAKGVNLRGHYTGHFLTMLAQSYASTGERVFRQRLNYMVDTLGECQDALTAAVGRPAPVLPIERVAGRFGSAVRLTGNSDHVALPTGVLSELRDFTIALWVNLAAATVWSRIFDFGTGTGNYMFLTASTGTTPRFSVTTGGGAAEQQLNAPEALATDTWTHLAVTHSGSTGTLYVNGEAVATNTEMTLSPADLGVTNQNWIGRSQYAADATVDATIDEFRIYDRALDPAEIQALTTSADGVANVVHYRFDETDATAVDSSGAGNNGTLIDGLGAPGPQYPGYLAAFPETLFIRLEALEGWPVWAPYYTCHKIMRGLLDAYYLAGNKQALGIALRLGDWVHSRLSRLSRDTLDKMWVIYSAGEYGAMNEVMAELYALTGKEEYIVAARCFDSTALLTATAANTDQLTGIHANHHIPQFLGYLRIFEQTGEDHYRTAARHFWDMVVPHRIYSHGGTSQAELFRARDAIASTLAPDDAESCCAHNMLKVSRNLFFHEPDAKYLDYYERTLCNQILGSRHNVESTTSPEVTYFVGMSPGTQRGVNPASVPQGYGNTGTCCGGTGIENHTKYQDTVYAKSADGSTLYVNLFMASTLRWAERGFTVTQKTDFPTEGASRLIVHGRGRLNLSIRVPSWAERFRVRVNGVPSKVEAIPGQYLTLRRTWSPGDTVDIEMPFRLRIEKTPDDPTVQSIFYGPVLLVALSDETTFREFSFYRDFSLKGDLSRAIRPADKPMHFTTHGLTLAPFYIGETYRYHAYFKRSEPTVAFGSVDSGVPNRTGTNGETFLDALWASAPFASITVFRSRVAALADEWTSAGLLTAEERDLVVAAAGTAELR